MTSQFEIDCALMSSRAYDPYAAPGLVPIPDGWGVDKTKNIHNPSSGSGFDMEVFRKGNDIVMAFAGIRGITAGEDLDDAGPMAIFGTVSDQLREAVLAYIELKKQYPDANITFAGHSNELR